MALPLASHVGAARLCSPPACGVRPALSSLSCPPCPCACGGDRMQRSDKSKVSLPQHRACLTRCCLPRLPGPSRPAAPRSTPSWRGPPCPASRTRSSGPLCGGCQSSSSGEPQQAAIDLPLGRAGLLQGRGYHRRLPPEDRSCSWVESICSLAVWPGFELAAFGSWPSARMAWRCRCPACCALAPGRL